MNLLKKISIGIIVPALLFFSLEGLLFLLGQNVVNNQLLYPRHPENYLKIAVFGGSSAKGFAAGRSFSDVLSHELKTSQSRKIYLRNFAQYGATFNRSQAEIAKAVVPYFDVLIVYAAHNEIWNATYDHHRLDVYDIPIDERDNSYAKDIVKRFPSQVAGHFSVRDVLEGKSRLFASLKKLKEVVQKKVMRAPAIPKPVKHPPMTADKKVVPEKAISDLGRDFEQDLVTLKSMTEKQGKILIVCTVPSYLTWPPLFSKGRDGMSDKEKKYFEDLLIQRTPGALREALKIDPLHARANYLMGMSELGNRNFSLAWKHLEMAKDEDGWPVRARSDINQRIRTLMSPSDHCVEIEGLVLGLIEKGASFDDFFFDFQHPDFLLHVLIARSIVPLIPLLEGKQQVLNHLDAVMEGGQSKLDEYRSELGLTGADVQEGNKLNFNWLLNLRHHACDPTKFFDFASRALARMDPETRNSKEVQSRLSEMEGHLK